MSNPPHRVADLNVAIQEAICDSLRAGNYLVTAAAAGGVHRTTLTRWLSRGESGEEEPYASFYNAVKIAEAEGETKLLHIVETAAMAGPQNWVAAMTMLERRHRERWGRSERREIETKAAPMPEERSELLKQIREELARIDGEDEA